MVFAATAPEEEAQWTDAQALTPDTHPTTQTTECHHVRESMYSDLRLETTWMGAPQMVAV